MNPAATGVAQMPPCPQRCSPKIRSQAAFRLEITDIQPVKQIPSPLLRYTPHESIQPDWLRLFFIVHVVQIVQNFENVHNLHNVFSAARLLEICREAFGIGALVSMNSSTYQQQHDQLASLVFAPSPETGTPEIVQVLQKDAQCTPSP
jgi:hypothetical protein